MTIEVTTTVEVVLITAQLLEVVLTTERIVIILKHQGQVRLGATIGHHSKIGSIAELLGLVVLPQELHVPHRGMAVQVLDQEVEDSVNNHQPRLTALCNT